MVERWLEHNKRAHEQGDWHLLSEMFTLDATYGWNLGPSEEFMAVGREEIHDFAVGMEMVGLESWSYPYQKVIIDERQGEVVGFWKQIADVERPDGSPYEVAGFAGSWFRYAGNWQWSWQRDFFDFGNVTALFVEMMKAEALSDEMRARLGSTGGPRRGHYPIGESPVGMWD